jgi:hypothetical protein
MSLASRRRFWAMSASVNSKWAPRRQRSRRPVEVQDALQMSEQHLDALAVPERSLESLPLGDRRVAWSIR